MKQFSELYQSLDQTTKTNAKIAAIQSYFQRAPTTDAAYAIYFLLGNKLRPSIPTRTLRVAAIQASGIPAWLLEHSYEWVGDLAETLAAIVPETNQHSQESLSTWVEEKLAPLSRLSQEQQIDQLIACWRALTSMQRFVMNKLITGNFRVGVSQKLLTRALSDFSGVPVETLAHRLMGGWEPTAQAVDALLRAEDGEQNISRPYPFCLANPLPGRVEEVGECSAYLAEWKWDGIRAQIIRREGQTFVWSRGEELMHGRFPEIEAWAAKLPDGTVLDGEILGWHSERPLPFLQLQRRIQRLRPGPKLLAEVPVIYVAFDLLESYGIDRREWTLGQRRSELEKVVSSLETIGDNNNIPLIRLGPPVLGDSWEKLAIQREQARELGAEGLMLKSLTACYEVGRVTGTWWKWKLDPYQVDAVLIYAQRGHGRRAALYTDYTFALWDGDRLVPFAKAYSGLTDQELRRVDRWIREHTLQRFGPVHEVEPHWVMELAFENVQLSNRHKSGLAVRFPRIVRIREDKPIEQADTLERVKAMIDAGQRNLAYDE